MLNLIKKLFSNQTKPEQVDWKAEVVKQFDNIAKVAFENLYKYEDHNQFILRNDRNYTGALYETKLRPVDFYATNNCLGINDTNVYYPINGAEQVINSNNYHNFVYRSIEDMGIYAMVNMKAVGSLWPGFKYGNQMNSNQKE